VRKLAVVLLGGSIIVGGSFGARALATHATATVDPGPPPCAHVSVAVDGTPVNVDQNQCAPSGAPDLPDLPAPPSLPNPGDLPAPSLPAPPSLPNPGDLPAPSVPSVPSLPSVNIPTPGAAAAGLGSGCTFQSQEGTSPNEQRVTLPDGTVIYISGTDPTAMSGYLGGSNALGKLEGGGTVSTGGVTGYIGGHNNQTGADGYVSTGGACLNGNSLP
jgi:hypothetical protein